MDLWNFSIKWHDVSSHGEESHMAIVTLPLALKAYAVLNIGIGPEFGGHTIEIFDKELYSDMPLAEVHSTEDLPLEDQAVAAIAALVKWVKEAVYRVELDELDPTGEFYVR